MINFYDFNLEIAKSDYLVNLYKTSLGVRGDVPVDEKYVRDCESFLLFRRGRLIGGCIFNDGSIHPFRYLEVYKSEDDKKLSLITEGIEESEIMELTCIFLNAKSNFERIAFYTMIFYKTRSLLRLWGKKVIIGGSIHTKVQKIQMRLMRHVILRTTVNESLNMDGHKNSVVMIYYCTGKEFVRNAIFGLFSIAMDAFTRKKTFPSAS